MVPLLTVSGAGSDAANGDYTAVRADLGSQGAIKRVSHYTKVGDEDIRIVAFRYFPSMCCYWDPGCFFHQATLLGRRREKCTQRVCLPR